MPPDRPRRVPLDIRALSGREEIFRVSQGSRRDPAVETWLAAQPQELRSVAKQWFGKMRQCGADVRELMHDGCPVACVADAPFGYVNTFTAHVNIGFFNGAGLDDPLGLLEGSGKRMRHVRLTSGRKIDCAALTALIETAYRDIRARLEVDQDQRRTLSG
jgi:hypothetical protein